MKIEGSVALVTGANRGLGAAFTRGLLAAGAAKVYAAARDPATVTLPGVVPVRLDVTRPEHIATLARELPDVTLLVNNAGIGEFGPLLAPNAIDALRRQFETNAVACRPHDTQRARGTGGSTPRIHRHGYVNATPQRHSSESAALCHFAGPVEFLTTTH